MKFTVLTVEYLRWIQFDEGYREETIKTHRKRVATLAMRWIDRDIETIAPVDILTLKQEMIENKRDTGYINAYLSIFRMLLSFCRKFYKELKVLEPDDIDLLPEIYNPVIVNTKDEVDELFRFLDGMRLQDYRNRAILATILDTSARCCEWTRLNRDQFKEIEQGETEVIAKGGIMRFLFFTWSREYIKDYLEQRLDDHEALFVTHCRDSRWHTQRLKPDGFRMYLRQARKKLNIIFRPHKFRKTAITNWIENGMELPDAADDAGHRNINTTKKYYVWVNRKRLKEWHKKYSEGGITLV